VIHPLGALDAAGCIVTIDADDPALFGTTLVDEYRYVAEPSATTPSCASPATRSMRRSPRPPQGAPARALRPIPELRAGGSKS
jgi:hypothetical protein